MARRRNIYFKWLIALVVIVALLIVVYYDHLPDMEDEVTEQVEDIDWQEIDRVEIIGNESVSLIKEGDNYYLFKGDSGYHISTEQVHNLFGAFNNFQEGELQPVDFEQWSSNQADTTAIVLRLYDNTEEVLNLYIYPKDRSTYYRYLSGTEVYRTRALSGEQSRWLDMLGR